jgi:hypothetical protein
VDVAEENLRTGTSTGASSDAGTGAEADKGTGPFVQIANEPDRNDDYKSPHYELHNREVWFSKEMIEEQNRNVSPLWEYIRNSRLLVGLTAPFIYGCIVPFVLIDLFISIYQWVAFPIYGIPKVRRGDYIVFDRGRLCYLNLLERINCAYCSYGNGVIAFVTEIAARTEQHGCPIRHAHRIYQPHDRYSHFIPYGNAAAYRANIEQVRTDFRDIEREETEAAAD